MTREDIKRIFPDATDEAVTAMLNAHHNDTPKADELKALREKAAAYDKHQQDQLTLEEKARLALEEAEKLKAQNLRALNRTKALNEFVKGGLTAEEAEKFVDSIVTEDEAGTIQNVQLICGVFKAKSDALVKAAKEEVVKSTPHPDDKGNGSSGGETVGETIAKKLAASGRSDPGGTLKYYTGGNQG